MTHTWEKIKKIEGSLAMFGVTCKTSGKVVLKLTTISYGFNARVAI